MRFLAARDFRIRPRFVWRTLKEEKDIIITLNGRPAAILSHVDEGSLEATIGALRRQRAAIALEMLQEEAIQNGITNITDEEIEAEIEAVRNKRRQ